LRLFSYNYTGNPLRRKERRGVKQKAITQKNDKKSAQPEVGCALSIC
jgi:hypothetical protein